MAKIISKNPSLKSTYTSCHFFVSGEVPQVLPVGLLHSLLSGVEPQTFQAMRKIRIE